MFKVMYILVFMPVLTYTENPRRTIPNARVQYSNIFQTVPVLLEHFIEVLEDKPEVLEKDDLKVFTVDNSQTKSFDNNIKRQTPHKEDVITTPSVYNDSKVNLKYNVSSSDDEWELTTERIIEKTLEVEMLLDQYNS